MVELAKVHPIALPSDSADPSQRAESRESVFEELCESSTVESNTQLPYPEFVLALMPNKGHYSAL
jgi:hypothetical protein